MGLLDWIFGGTSSNVQLDPDRIWLTSQAKSAGLFRAVEAALPERVPPPSILLVCHFEESQAQLQAIADRYSGTHPVTVMLVDRLTNRFDRLTGSTESERILLLVSDGTSCLLMTSEFWPSQRNCRIGAESPSTCRSTIR